MSYTVLARKYRPQTFADLSGQDHVTRTLGNAIASGRVAHAFLFTGVRGVGKTTTARILAKALNCSTGPTASPCGICDACKEITVGVDLDVLEIDGASNNSVDDVRRLQETIPFRPARDRFKIVIVDEVHMLSTGAFNAFLKTLEEPPPFVKFISATTESHKVPVTIRSRCQRYDFRLIPQAIVAMRVRQILGIEGIEADDDAVGIVAREAAGSMRDALTLLDQIVAFSGSKLIGEEVARVLGIADRELLHGTASAILDGEGASVLRNVDALAQRGLDLLHFTKALVEFLRDIVVLQVSGAETELVSLVEEERRRALDLSKRVESLEVQRAFHGASMLVEDVAKSPLPRMTLEMGLVRLASRPPLRPLAELVQRLDALDMGRSPAGTRTQRSGREASSSPTRARASAGSDADPEPPGEGQPSESIPSPIQAPNLSPIQAPAPTQSPSIRPVFGGDPRFAKLAASVPELPNEDDPNEPFGEPIAGDDYPFAEDGVEFTESSAGFIEAPSLQASPPQRTPQRAPQHTPAPSVRPAPSQRPPTSQANERPRSIAPAPLVFEPSLDPDAMALWEVLVGVLADTRPALGALLKHAVPMRVDSERIVLLFAPSSFYGKQASSSEAKNGLIAVAERRLGGTPEIEVQYGPVGNAPTLAQLEEERQRARLEATRKRALFHPVVQEAMRLFKVGSGQVEVRIEVEDAQS